MNWQSFVRTLLSVGIFQGIGGCSGEKPSGSCSAFESCGGNVEGTWTISGSCIDGNLRAVANLNPNLPVACQGMYKNVAGEMTGRVTFGAGTANVDTVFTVSSEVSLDADCAKAFGVPSLDVGMCVNLGPTLATEKLHDSAVCELSGDRCNCRAANVYEVKEDRTYSVAGSRITYSGSKDYLDFCVGGNTLHARQFNSDLIVTIFIDAQHQ